ncbi:helix-turn-helix transcriptional regulator [Micrococcales bacterium 31B]|nr:helix-turn-helix transcriptional regulator [Micrococcales bacterium 31B]
MASTPECCTPAAPGAPLGAAADDIARVFKALADPNRVRLFAMIAALDGGEACVCDLTAPLNLGQPTVSHHLKVLVEAGLLAREKRGVWAYYSLVPGALETLTAPLTGKIHA